MLESNNAIVDLSADIAEAWREAHAEAFLPHAEKALYFEREGLLPASFDEHRNWPRYYLRAPALLELDRRPGSILAVYCRDISQSGVAILSPYQAFPLQTGVLTLSAEKTLRVRVRRCRRMGDRCYVLGCDYEADVSH